MDIRIMEAVSVLTDAQSIPFYAYGDNEAACSFAESIRQALAILTAEPEPCDKCKGTGKIYHECTLCGDSTYDHFCNDYEEPCPHCAAIFQGTEPPKDGMSIIQQAIQTLQQKPSDIRDNIFEARKTIAIASAAVDSFGIGSIDQEQLVKLLYTARDILSKIMVEMEV